jgi:hypothetical protein
MGPLVSSAVARAVVCSWMSLWASGPVSRAEAPRVVKAVPDNDAQEVDPTLAELRIEFDQAMSPGGRSVVGGGPQFPRLVGKARWVDDHTFVWAIRLEAAFKLLRNAGHGSP